MHLFCIAYIWITWETIKLCLPNLATFLPPHLRHSSHHGPIIAVLTNIKQQDSPPHQLTHLLCRYILFKGRSGHIRGGLLHTVLPQYFEKKISYSRQIWCEDTCTSHKKPAWNLYVGPFDPLARSQVVKFIINMMLPCESHPITEGYLGNCLVCMFQLQNKTWEKI